MNLEVEGTTSLRRSRATTETERAKEEIIKGEDHMTPEGRKFWIITEADRSVTTILLPEEY